MSSRKDRTNDACTIPNYEQYIFDIKSRNYSGVYAAIVSFLLFAMIQFRDGPFIRPHPAFWRIILGVNLLYELALVFLLFQDVKTARSMMTFIDPSLGISLPEKSYAEDCSLSGNNFWVIIPFQKFVYILPFLVLTIRH